MQWKVGYKCEYVIGSPRKSVLIRFFRFSIAGELTQGTARGSTVSGSVREQIEDGLHENGINSHHQYDIKCEEDQWKEARHAGYYAQGPPQLYSSSSAPQGQDVINQEETAENDDKSGIFFNGFWIPDSDLDHFSIINNSDYGPFFRQIPVFLCPPMMPYCSAPYPQFRTPYPSDAPPVFPNFCIPSDPHYYHHFTRPRTTSEEEDQPFEAEEEKISPPITDNDKIREEQEVTQEEPNCDDGENQPAPVFPEMLTGTALQYPYPGYSFGEPVYSVPIYPLLPPPPTQRAFPRLHCSATQNQRKRRRKRKEYNAEYAVIPPTKNSAQESTGTTAGKCDLGTARNETACNNGSCNQRKGNSTHSVSVTGSSPSTKEAKQNDCVLNNQGNDDNVESAYLSQGEITLQDARNLVGNIVNTPHNEFSKNVHCKVIDNTASGSCEITSPETGDVLIHEILSELIQEVVNECQQVRKQSKKRNNSSSYGSTQNETENLIAPQNLLSHTETNPEYLKINNNVGDLSPEFFGISNESSVSSVGRENRAATHVEMENFERKNQNPDFPEVHKKMQDDLGIANKSSYTSSKHYYDNEISGDSFVQNENRKNLSNGKPAKLLINEENNFFDISLVPEVRDAEPAKEEGLFLQSESDLQTSVKSNNIEHENNVDKNKQNQILEDGPGLLEQGDLRSEDATTEKQSDCSSEKYEGRTDSQSELENTSGYLNRRTDTSGIANYKENEDTKEHTLDKTCDDSLDSITSNESYRDRDRQLSGSHRSSPHSFLSYVTNSEAFIRETELELSKIQHLTSRPPLLANQSIYKFAFDENLTDQSETEDTMTPIPSPLPPELSNGYSKDAHDPEDVAVSAEMRQDIQRSEIIVHEGDSGSEAGSEDVELLPHRYESQCGDKHLYVNKLSLAVELLRTHENLPYDDEFKRVVDDEGENIQSGNGAAATAASSKSRSSNKPANVQSGTVNPAFVGDLSPKIQVPVEISPQLNNKNARPVVDRIPTSLRNPQENEQGQHRHSRISTADSGVQSEDSGDEIGEEAKEPYGRLGFTESEEQELWNPADDATMEYRRFGVQARQRFNIFAPRAGGLNPCFCCTIM